MACARLWLNVVSTLLRAIITAFTQRFIVVTYVALERAGMRRQSVIHGRIIAADASRTHHFAFPSSRGWRSCAHRRLLQLGQHLGASSVRRSQEWLQRRQRSLRDSAVILAPVRRGSGTRHPVLGCYTGSRMLASVPMPRAPGTCGRFLDGSSMRVR